MLREFFASGKACTTAWAWIGFLVIAIHSLLRAYLKFKFNEFYAEFYDVGGRAVEVGSGDFSSLDQGKSEVRDLLFRFALLCVPEVVLHPVYKYLVNEWVLSWRAVLVQSYVERWKMDGTRIENGAQRVHEDTQRFARGVQNLCVVVLDSVLTLIVFVPLLLTLGTDVNPWSLPDSWLAVLCVILACAGFGGSVIFGSSLVSLEVQNQVVEADLRKKLVILEEYPHTMADEDKQLGYDSAVFRCLIIRLVTNYKRLYRAFAVFSLWLGAYEQTVSILPYAIAAPMLYERHASMRITLGSVTQLSHAFSQVFASLNIISSNWLDVTDWLSVLRRLRQWEIHISAPVLTCTDSLMSANHTHSSSPSQSQVEMLKEYEHKVNVEQ